MTNIILCLFRDIVKELVLISFYDEDAYEETVLSILKDLGYSYYNGAYSHSTLIEIPVSGGIIGSFLYFYMYFISIRKTILLLRQTSNRKDMKVEYIQVKMLLILWSAYLFYCTCIIHVYQYGSAIVFGLIFGQTNYLESKLCGYPGLKEKTVSGCKYIKP